MNRSFLVSYIRIGFYLSLLGGSVFFAVDSNNWDISLEELNADSLKFVGLFLLGSIFMLIISITRLVDNCYELKNKKAQQSIDGVMGEKD